MSYEDTKCVCGGVKLTDTLLCAECVAAYTDNVYMKIYENEQGEHRRSAAIKLLALARKRKQ